MDGLAGIPMEGNPKVVLVEKKQHDLATTELVQERHFSVNELAEMWNLSRDFISRQFRDEEGVVEWTRQKPGKHRYRVLRIPESVALRVYRRFQVQRWV